MGREVRPSGERSDPDAQLPTLRRLVHVQDQLVPWPQPYGDGPAGAVRLILEVVEQPAQPSPLERRRDREVSPAVGEALHAVYLSDEGRTSLIKAWEAHKEEEVSHAILDRRIGRWALPSVQATLLARHLRGDLPDYPPYVLP